ncbi:MAG: polysaccharide biosynthesis/export family protein [Pseudorhodobacter sp.]
MKKSIFRFCFVTTLALAACAPADGPSTGKVLRSARQNDVPIIDLSQQVVGAIGTTRASSGGDLSKFAARSYVPGVIKSGDSIAITIFDTGEDGLFTMTNSTSMPLGEFTVSPNGTVSIPFVGTVQVHNRSTASAQRLLTEKLRESSVNPYATVNITMKETDSYTVQGSVRAGGVQSLTARSERVLDAIAAAGGPEGKPDETVVTLVRNGQSGQQTLSRIVTDPAQNVSLAPGDVLIVGGGDATFIADGALVSTGEFPFAEGSLSLGQAVSMAGGLSDRRSNPRSVFVFRSLRPSDRIHMVQRDGSKRLLSGDIILRANFSDPSERLRANKFQMRDGDVLYVGNAPLAHWSKYFQIFNSPPEVPAVPQ